MCRKSISIVLFFLVYFNIHAETRSHWNQAGNYLIQLMQPLEETNGAEQVVLILDQETQTRRELVFRGQMFHIQNALSDEMGNTVIYGYFSDHLTIENQTLFSSGNTDLFICVLDASGNAKQMLRLGGYGVELILGMESESVGFVLTTLVVNQGYSNPRVHRWRFGRGLTVTQFGPGGQLINECVPSQQVQTHQGVELEAIDIPHTLLDETDEDEVDDPIG